MCAAWFSRRQPCRSADVRLAAVLLAGLAVACGGSPETAAADSAPAATAQTQGVDPCAVVTAAEASKALGATVAAPDRPKEANFPPRMVTCRYTAKRGQGLAVMTVMVNTAGSDSEARAGFGSAREQFPVAETVAGLGDEAFWFANQLNVRRGRVYLNLTGDFDRAAATGLATQALTRLP